MKKIWGLEPVLALWSLGSIIGLPALLFSLGYLVHKGHNSLLNVPTVLLPSSAEHLVFLGGQWVVMTLKIIAWNKVTLAATLAVICAIWLVRRFKFKVTTKLGFMNRANLIIMAIPTFFFILSAILVIVEFNIISYTSEILTATTETKSDRVLMYYFEDKDAAATREWIYYFLSLASLIVGTGLFRIFNKSLLDVQKNISTPSKTFSTRDSFLQFFTVVLGLLALLNLPMCYGRLILSYNRPVIQFEMKDKEKAAFPTGLVLNPTGDKWLIVAKKKQNDIDFYEFSNVEMKDLKQFRINTEADLFDYLKDAKNVQGN